MTALSKVEIVEAVVSELDVSRKDAAQTVEHFFSVLSDVLVQGESVKLSGFGNFTIRTKKARPGRNPKTGEQVMVTARRVATFKSGVTLKKRVTSVL